MEKIYKRVPHNLALSTKIINGLIEGRIVSDKDGIVYIELPEETPKHEFKVGNKVRVNLPKDIVTKYLILGNYQGKVATIINVEGSYVKVKADGLQPYSFDVDYLIPYEEKHEFKPFDKVLVRNKNNRWYPRFYAETDGLLYYTTDSKNWEECIPYEGNEYLVGTTNNPE